MKPARSDLSKNMWQGMGVWSVLIALYVLLAIREPSFRGWVNMRNVLTQISMVAVVGVGMTYVILTGGIDLSVGSAAALAGCVSGTLMVDHHWSGALGILVTLLLGIALGLVNGLAVTWVRLPPFIATLATMVIARGLAFIISGGGAIYNLPDAYLWAGSGNVWEACPLIEKLPFVIVLMAILYFAGHIQLQRTRLGRYIYSVGSNEEASRLSGVPTGPVVLYAYVLCATLAAVSGMLIAGYVGAAEPTAGDGMELDVIAAVVIGGTSLSGGVGNLPGTFAGALLTGLVRNGLNLMQVNSNWQKVAIGAIIFLAVTLDRFQKRRRRS